MTSIFSSFMNIFRTTSPVAPSPVPQSFPQFTPAPSYAPRGGWLDAVEDASVATAGRFTLYDPSGNPVQFDPDSAKGAGGEGTVYEVPKYPKFLVKVFKEEILRDPRKAAQLRRRIEDMVALEACAQMDFLAWPKMSVFDERKRLVGFVMKKCTGASFLTLRGPKFIQMRFPGWTRRNLALTALDFIKKVRLLASRQVFINDFNPANFLVSPDGKVSFIDCDSYQIPGAQGANITRTYFPSHVAPELLRNKRLLDAPRGIHQVEFGAALTVFNLLMCGMHPYNFCDPVHHANCGTPDENLLNGRCPLGTGAGCLLPKGGWYNMWSWLTYRLKDAFIRMFKDGHANPNARPSLEELASAVEELLVVMKKDPQRQALVPTTAKPPERKSGGTGGGRIAG